MPYWFDWLPYYSNRTKFPTRVRASNEPVQATDKDGDGEEEGGSEEGSNESSSLLHDERVSGNVDGGIQ